MKPRTASELAEQARLDEWNEGARLADASWADVPWRGEGIYGGRMANEDRMRQHPCRIYRRLKADNIERAVEDK